MEELNYVFCLFFLILLRSKLIAKSVEFTHRLSSQESHKESDSSSGNSVKNLVSQKKIRNIADEKWWHTLLQVSIPFLIAGMGTIGAGIVLGRVDVSHKIDYFFYVSKSYPN